MIDVLIDEGVNRRGRKRSFLLKLGIFILPVIIGSIALNVVTIREETDKIEVDAPMQKHVKVSNRARRSFTGKKVVALTFDDGPRDTTTPYLLDILREKNVYATFFALGYEVEMFPDIAIRAVEEGHEVASHTMWHQNLVTLADWEILDDIASSNEIFLRVLGYVPKYIRPPYGNYNDSVAQIANVPLITWSVDSLDWRDRDTASILAHCEQGLQDGAIILMHDIHPTTIEAVPILIDQLRAEGYEFATLTELAEYRKMEMLPGVVYRDFNGN